MKKLICIIMLLAGTTAFAQDKEKTAALVNSKQYVFTATQAFPQNPQDIAKVMGQMPGGTAMINLDGARYTLTVKGDSLIADLPYYGRAFTVSMDPTDRPIRFTSKDFAYKASQNKRGNWIIDMNTKDTKENFRMTLNITEDGTASLNITGQNRSSISFNGNVIAYGGKRGL